MTIQSQTRTAGPFVGSGAVVPYPFNFKVFQPTDLMVVRSNPDGSETTLTMAAEYNVTLNTDQETAPGGIVQMVAGLPSGYSVLITSAIPELQKVLLTNQGGFYPRVISDALDYLTILIQQLRGPVSRSLKFPFSDSGMSATLPSAADRANSLLGFDSAGRPVVTVPGSDSAVGVGLALSAFISNLLADAGSSLIGFIQTGVGAVRRTVLDKLRDTISARDFGVVGDFNGTTGTDNSTRILRGIQLSASTGRAFIMDVQNVGVLSIKVDSLDGWQMIVTGSMHSLATKPVPGASDEKDLWGGGTANGASLITLNNCKNFKLSGRYIDPRYREAFWITNCSDFSNELEVFGAGLNDNLAGALYRYCTNFRFGQPITAATRAPTTGYYQWCNAVTVWDCSNFRVTGAMVSKLNGGNGLYVGSNCKDFIVEEGGVYTLNAMSGIQFAWSSFGVFPYRWTIGAVLTNGNRADGIDINNTDGSIARIDGKIIGATHVNNGYNTDGSITADGSGIGTFQNVSHFQLVGCNSTDSARAGFFAYNCTDFKADGFVSKQKSAAAGNAGEGIYLQNCSRYTVNVNAITRPDQEALKLFGIHANGSIGGELTGLIALPDPDGTTSYDNVKLWDAKIVTTQTVVGNIEVVDSSIRCTTTALIARKNVTDSTTYAQTGTGLSYGADGVCVSGGNHYGASTGTTCSGFTACSLVGGAVTRGGSGPASHWINTLRAQITGITAISGSANSIRTEANCLQTVLYGTNPVGPLSLEGTFTIIF